MKQIIFFSFLSLALHFNGKDYLPQDRKTFLIQKEDTTNFTIIKFDKSNHAVFNKSYKQTKLSKTEIKDLQKVLDSIVNLHNQFLKMDSSINYNDLAIDLNQYKRQFIPAINIKGEKEVLVNCICLQDIPSLTKSKINWRKDSFKVNDGGKCYFHLVINLRTKEYKYFTVNGN